MRIKVIFFITVIAIVALFVMVQLNNKKSQPIITSAAPAVTAPVPTELLSSNMDSPDGSRTLTLEKKGMSYSLFISSKSEGQKVQIYKKEEVDSHKLEIPYNTWSPDNVYVFLKEKTPAIDNYLVFQSSGNLFSNGLSYVTVQELFKKNMPDYIIEDITGWAAPNLLIVNAKLISDDKKVSFWFDVPSQSFTQLGTYFK